MNESVSVISDELVVSLRVAVSMPVGLKITVCVPGVSISKTSPLSPVGAAGGPPTMVTSTFHTALLGAGSRSTMSSSPAKGVDEQRRHVDEQHVRPVVDRDREVLHAVGQRRCSWRRGR